LLKTVFQNLSFVLKQIAIVKKTDDSRQIIYLNVG